MKFFTKQRVLILVIIFLLITNLATLFTIGYHRWMYRHNYDNNPRARITKFIQEELNFSQKQMNEYQLSKKEFRNNEKKLYGDVCVTRLKIYKELSQQNPDTIKLDSLSKQFGSVFTEINKSNVKSYLKTIAICDEQQKVKLKGIFKEVYTNEEKKHKESRDND
ncbi:MAG: hypothetical protein PHD97_06990 [Bacteroidales bacterium]|nr:hypothetical protein [Bacteroidales bacterium]